MDIKDLILADLQQDGVDQVVTLKINQLIHILYEFIQLERSCLYN